MEDTTCKGEERDLLKILGPRLAEKHTLPPHPQIDKQMPSRRSERSEASGGALKPNLLKRA